jgi:hypothetical protein
MPAASGYSHQKSAPQGKGHEARPPQKQQHETRGYDRGGDRADRGRRG